MSTTCPPLDQVRLVRCTPAQARVAVLNNPPEAPEDLAALLARAEAEPSDIASWALVPLSHPETLDLLSHCVTYRRSATIAYPSGEQDAVAYGLSEVFTSPAYRRHGYARRMLQLLHYVLAPADRLPPFPVEFGAPPRVPGFGDASLSFLHSGIDGAFYAQCTPGVGSSSRAGWVPKPPYTRLWRVPESGALTEYQTMSADDVATLQGEYVRILRGRLAPGQVAVIPDLSTIRRLAPPSHRQLAFGGRLEGGWFTYLKLRPAKNMPWRITLSLVHGDVPFSAVAQAARREGASVIEYGGTGFSDWDDQGVEIDTEWPKPCICTYGVDELEWVAPEALIIEAAGVPGHWAWY